MKMQLNHLFRAGFRHYLKANFWVALGVAVSTAVLTGGLVVGGTSGMTYALQQDLIDRFGESELIQLTDRTNVPPTDVDDVVVGRALADADGTIDGYIGKKYASRKMGK